nr:MAG TPA: LysW [Caudoviricetes sp.]
MVTIVQGNKDVLKDYRYFKCGTCGWAGKAEKGEYNHGDQREPECWMKCPCCGRTAHEVISRSEIQLLMEKEKENNHTPILHYPPGVR